MLTERLSAYTDPVPPVPKAPGLPAGESGLLSGQVSSDRVPGRASGTTPNVLQRSRRRVGRHLGSAQDDRPGPIAAW